MAHYKNWLQDKEKLAYQKGYRAGRRFGKKKERPMTKAEFKKWEDAERWN